MTRLPFPIWWSIYVEHRLQYARLRGVRLRPLNAIGRGIYLARRFLAGAHRVELAPFGETGGTYSAPGISVTFGGACPVQGEGTVDGREVYYRSRGEGWEFDVAPAGDDSEDAVFGPGSWEYSERGYFWPDGGWVSPAVSRACIEKAVAKWRAEQPNVTQRLPNDCLRCAVASLLQLPYEQVPHFVEEAGQDCWLRLAQWAPSVGREFDWHPTDPGVPCIAKGPSPRRADVTHAVVWFNGAVALDPHPSRDGLAGEPSMFATLEKAEVAK